MLLFFCVFVGLWSACCLRLRPLRQGGLRPLRGLRLPQGRGDEILRSYAAHELPLLRNSYLVLRTSARFWLRFAQLRHATTAQTYRLINQ